MELRTLGRTGLRVSALGLGTTKLGRREGVKYPADFALPDDDMVRRLFSAARAGGINLIDTAPAYGSAEARIGELLDGAAGWLVGTKAGESFEDGRSSFDFSAEGIHASVARSRRLLRRERLDLVLLHCGDDDLAVLRDSPALPVLRELRAAGQIGAVGASTKTVAGGLWAVGQCDVVMLAINRADRSQLPVLDAARQAGCGVLVKKALASGHDGDPAGALAEIASLPGVASVIVGTIDPDHLLGNCRAVEG